MFGIGSRRTRARHTTTTGPTLATTSSTHTAGRPRRHFFRKRVNPDRRAAGLKVHTFYSPIKPKLTLLPGLARQPKHDPRG